MGWWDGGGGWKDAGQTSWLSPDLFVKTSLTSFMIALFLTTVAVYKIGFETDMFIYLSHNFVYFLSLSLSLFLCLFHP